MQKIPARWRLGASMVPKGRYVDPEFLGLELAELFPRVWQVACREEEVAEIGKFVVVQIGNDSIIVVRTKARRIEAFFNSCRHRGTQLLDGRGRVGEFRCPVHSWRWELDGSFKHRPDDAYFEPVDPRELCLPQCKVDAWAGFIFVNLDSTAQPLLDYLSPLPERLRGFRIEDMRYVWHKSFDLPGNWKTSLDAFLEAYHTAGTHPQYLRRDFQPSTPGSPAEQDLFPPSLTEDHGLHGRTLRPDPVRDEPPELTERRNEVFPRDLETMKRQIEYQLNELGSLNTRWDLAAVQEAIDTTSASDASEQYERFLSLRIEKAAAEGVQLPSLSRQQVHNGAYGWHVFPNTILLVTGVIGCLLGYRALPHPTDPERCRFDVFALELPGSQSEGSVEHEYFPNWREAGLGEVLTQDFSNIERITSGMRSVSFEGHRLNLRQEMVIHQYHANVDRYLFGSASSS